MSSSSRLRAPDYRAQHAQSCNDPSSFWETEAKRLLHWQSTGWKSVKETRFGKDDVWIRWFEGGALNVCENCVDRHLAAKGDKPAIIWEPDNPTEANRILTYRQLHAQVVLCANMLRALGVGEGDTVTIYMPMVPEAAIAMLACARIGAIHSVVFGGFSSHSLRDRIDNCNSKLVITSDGGYRGGKIIPLKEQVDLACHNSCVENVLVLKRTGTAIGWTQGRDVWWHELAQTVPHTDRLSSFDAEHPLFILYTSGSTGKPKGLMHTAAGYLLYAQHTFTHVFDYQEGDIFWCTADVGWVTGHSYIVYGPLAAGATTLMFEGVPNYPDASRFWDVVDKYHVTQFYTAPTAIRMLMREGEEILARTSRDSLRILGSVGEPINPEAWRWYHEHIGKGRCAIVDTWWQTETGGHLITPLPGVIPTKPGSATLPYFGITPVICSPEGAALQGEAQGALCIADSWPGQARTIWGDHARFIKTYFSPYPGYYFSGDAAHRDADGYYWIEGRMDDVINVAGHRIGTAEVESALILHEAVTEAAVVGYPHPIKGQDIYAYVTLKPGFELTDTLRQEMNQLVRREIGPIATVGKIQSAPGLPKTRSGKIMRRILRKIAHGEIRTQADYEKLGDISTLLNPDSVDDLVKGCLID